MTGCTVCQIVRCPLTCVCGCHTRPADPPPNAEGFHASRSLFAAEPDPVRELSVADWIGGVR